jgi:hypothetical protein
MIPVHHLVVYGVSAGAIIGITLTVVFAVIICCTCHHYRQKGKYSITMPELLAMRSIVTKSEYPTPHPVRDERLI